MFDALRLYNHDYDRTNRKLIRVNIFMVHMTSRDKAKNIRINVEFVVEDAISEKLGVPYYVFIGKDDTLRDIINQHFRNLSMFFKQIHIKGNGDRKSIPEKEWDEYKLGDENERTLSFELKKDTADVMNGYYIKFEDAILTS